jgi:hypothetical protein
MNESVFAMAGYSVFRHAGTEVDYCFIDEDNICRLIINVQPELKLIKDLLPIALPSSPAIANTFVARSFIEFKRSRNKISTHLSLNFWQEKLFHCQRCLNELFHLMQFEM